MFQRTKEMKIQTSEVAFFDLSDEENSDFFFLVVLGY
jgi:hypothetical protein